MNLLFFVQIIVNKRSKIEISIQNDLFRILKDEKIRRKKSNFTNINRRYVFTLPRLSELINGTL